MRRLVAWSCIALAAGCATRHPAPVVERTSETPPPAVAAPTPEPPPPVEKPLPTHVVKPKETLVGIALQYGLDYRELAAWNNITNPNSLKVGQVLVVARPPDAKPSTTPLGATPLANASPIIEARPLSNTPTSKVEPRGQKLPFSERALAQLGSPEPAGTAPAPANGSTATTPAPGTNAPLPTPPAPVATPPAPPKSVPTPAEPEKPRGTQSEDVSWSWPVKGKIIGNFTEITKGIDIAGKKGTPVRAAAGGRVIYASSADNALRGYGNLIIIRHNDTWLSAYAHHDKLLVKEQDEVKKGQKIAEMGSSDADQVKLHFEIRRQGKPVDPLKFLPKP